MHDPFGRTKKPATFGREGRVRLLGEAALDLLEGRMPSTEARMFLGGALHSWLQEGGALGSLERDYFRVTGPRRSTLTPSRLWQRAGGSTARATSAGEPDTIAAPDQPSEMENV